jgi:tetratricopeptide (TPR) repeat protein
LDALDVRQVVVFLQNCPNIPQTGRGGEETKMKRILMTVAAGLLLTLAAGAAAQQQPAYTLQEYNAYQAAANEANAQQRVKLLDDFAAKFPQSTLLPYAYRLYFVTYYNELKNFPKTIEYADRLLALGDQIDKGGRFEAIYTRSLAFHSAFNDKMSAEDLRRAREAVLEGLRILNELPKPEQLSDAQFTEQKKGPAALFNYTAGFVALQQKDFRTAIGDFRRALELQPNDPVTYFRMGVAHLSMDPPEHQDGFWALARSVALKGPGEAQVRDYLRAQLRRYQQTACEAEIDKQLTELVTLAGGAARRPPDFRFPSSADLEAARSNPNWITALKEGGPQAKVTWLAVCGLDFPEVVAKVIAVETGNASVILKVYSGATSEETEAATEPNMEVKVEGQPGVQRFQKDDFLRFSGTLSGYNPEPFLLQWTKGQVNPEDIPEEQAAPGKRGKRPGKRPPAR